MKVLALLFAILLLPGVAVCGTDSAGETLSVPTGADIHDELEHFMSLGLWRGSLAQRPLSRRDLTAIVAEIVANSEGLSVVELERLAALERYVAERTWRRKADAIPDDRFPASIWETGLGLQFFGGPSTVDSLIDPNHRPRRKGMIKLSLNAELAGQLSAELRFYENYSKLTSRPNADDWVDNLAVDFRGLFTDPFARLNRAVIGWDNDWLRFRFGREDRKMGQGRWGTLFLSENPFPLDGLSSRITTRYLSLYSLVAQNRRGPQPPSGLEGDILPDYINGDAWIAAHRIELRPPGPLTVGIFEAAAWGGRGLDLAYANPVGFLVSMTQDIWDRSRTDDKKVVGADFRLNLAPVSLYGEFLLDRLVALDAAEKGESAGISSFGELVGLRWASPPGLAGADLDLEYVHIDPQVYFHHDGDPRRFLLTEDTYNEGALLGHWLGPNTDGLFVALSLPPRGRLGRLRLEYQKLRYGMLDGMTGTQMGFIDMKRSEKGWISGEVAGLQVCRLTWRRNDLRFGLPGLLDADLSLAHINRTGAWSSVITDERESGWQIELRLNWRTIARLSDGWM
ncbi:MAG: capsule assembly Wzi family protein [bacterium]|nr:capsule assembly Wzi family protein [bacterium]